MNRRQWLAGGVVAAAAAAGGAYLGLRREAEVAGPSLWNLRFETPQGQPFAIADLRGRPLVLNFWAPWCEPCVREMPALDRFHRAYGPRGWQVLGIAIDSPQAVIAFLKKLPVGFPIVMAGLEGTDLGRRLGNSAGALPFSVVFDAEGRPQQHRLGEINDQELARWAA